MEGASSAPSLPSTELVLYEDRCTIKKRLTKSDLNGHSSRLVLPRRCVEDRLLPLMGEEMAVRVRSRRGMKVVVRNADTREEHKLVFRYWPSSKYVLNGDWNKFFEGQGWEIGDEIGMFWDQDDRKFHFTIHRKVNRGTSDAVP